MTTEEYSNGTYKRTGITNLNTLAALGDGGEKNGTSHPAPVVCDGVEVLFCDQRRRLIELITNSSAVVGCVAWLTDLSIL